jgi:regulatory protein
MAMRSDEKILKRLENKAVHYLGRYASTETRLREILFNFAKRKMANQDPDHLRNMINEVVTSCVEKGYVNDKLFAQQKTASLRHSGSSRLAISRKLRQRGVDPNIINEALDDYDEDLQATSPNLDHDAELEAALIYARKRRLGPYAKPGIGKTEMKDGWERRHYASFARAGFTGKTISTVMALTSTEEVEAILEEGRDL